MHMWQRIHVTDDEEGEPTIGLHLIGLLECPGKHLYFANHSNK